MRKSLVLFLSVLLLTIVSVSPAASFEKTFADAQTAYKNGQYDKAGALFEKVGAILLDSGDEASSWSIYNNAGVAYIKGEHYEAAAKVYENLLKNPKKLPEDLRAKFFKNLTICYIRQDKNALSIDAIERALKFLPKLPNSELSDLHAKSGDAYLRLELYGKAEESFKKAQEFLPKDSNPEVKARILTAIGLCQGNLGNFNNASKNLQEAYSLSQTIKIPLTEAESISNLGILYWERGDYEKAMDLLKTALAVEEKGSLRRNEGVDNNNLGLVQKSIGNYQDAMNSFEMSLQIAREVKNKKDEAIALVNRALLNRMTAHLNEARTDYRDAITLFKEIEFKEGLAGALLGVGKIAEVEDRNLAVALNYYKEALGIYTELGLPRGRAEALLQVGRVLKLSSMPTRTSRDLVFDDEPVMPTIDKNDALKEALDIYTETLAIATEISSKEMMWASYQGLGYCNYQAGKLEEAYAFYNKAIDMVTAMRTSLASVQLLGEYMSDKQDLYSEAMQVSAALYDKTNDVKYVEMQVRLDETLRNEIQKASTALMQMKFEDPKKQVLYQSLMELGQSQGKAEAAVPAIKTLSDTASAEEKKAQALAKEEAKKQKVAVQKLDQDYEKLLAEWQEKYPSDKVIFESNARVDIAKVQKVLADDQIMLQYINLPDKLLILAVSNSKVSSYAVPVSQQELDNAIRKDFLVKYIEGYRKRNNATTEKEGLQIATELFSLFNTWLIEPVKADLVGKKRIYIVASGFLSALPFSAIVTSGEAGNPHFLVEDYDISYVRPAFIDSLTSPNDKKSVKTLLAVGNPKHSVIVSLAPLEGAEKEAQYVSDIIKNAAMKDVQIKNEATEFWLVNNLKNNSYETLYFATHGVPYSEVYYSYYIKRNAFAKALLKRHKSEEPFAKEEKFIHDNIKTHSPLNGYLYLATEGDGSDTGLLTIKKILELPQEVFTNMRYAFLSACNTGVTFASKTLKNDKTINVLKESKNAEIEVRKAGWVPGVDQISFVEPFMRRGVNNVYATLWFADDTASFYLLSKFTDIFNAQGVNQDIVAAYSQTLREYIRDSRENRKILSSGHHEPLNPFYWAVGVIFGK